MFGRTFNSMCALCVCFKKMGPIQQQNTLLTSYAQTNPIQKLTGVNVALFFGVVVLVVGCVLGAYTYTYICIDHTNSLTPTRSDNESTVRQTLESYA